MTDDGRFDQVTDEELAGWAAEQADDGDMLLTLLTAENALDIKARFGEVKQALDRHAGAGAHLLRSTELWVYTDSDGVTAGTLITVDRPGGVRLCSRDVEYGELLPPQAFTGMQPVPLFTALVSNTAGIARQLISDYSTPARNQESEMDRSERRDWKRWAKAHPAAPDPGHGTGDAVPAQHGGGELPPEAGLTLTREEIIALGGEYFEEDDD